MFAMNAAARVAALGICVVASSAANALAADQTATFDANADGWTLTGAAAVDGSKGHIGGSLKVEPGGKAVWQLRDTDGSGKVELWVFDDAAVAAKPKDRRVGPRWGLVRKDGRMLATGVLYAPYLGGDTTYAVTDTDGKAPLSSVQYLGIKRVAQWQKWTFDFDAKAGLSILVNDKKVTRFDWNKTEFTGFAGIVLLGDDPAAKDNPHTVWVDDVAAQLGGPMASKPTPPPPPPPVTPDTDPAVAADAAVKLVPAVAGKHPRLLFTEADLPKLRAYAKGDGKPFFDTLMQYLPSAVPPKDAKYAADATDAQRQGLWRLPTVALHYVLTGDKQSFERSVGFLKAFVAQENWETGKEQDSGMAAANIMVGAALAYDWLYNDLDPAFRDQVRAKLLTHARRMYYGGHLMKNPGPHYWQNETHNNHRWHRDAGLTLAALAVADEGKSDDDWILAQTAAELKFVAQWLPHDGSTHESTSYMVFGAPHLTLALDAADRCLGTDYLAADFFKHTADFRLHTLLPGFADSFNYGDSDGVGYTNNYVLRAVGKHNQPDALAGIQQFVAASPKGWSYGWFSLVWANPDVKPGSVDRLPKAHLFDDMGLAFVRDGWAKDNVALMFKCSPYGGATLNRYRNENNFKYINVAHDDPDANMFSLYARGAVLAENDRYAAMKATSSHNTILVDGKGQFGEGQAWTQPLNGPRADMTKLARITAWQSGDGLTVAEGEAGASYAGLAAYRRTMVWVEGKYVLVLDSIASDGPDREIAWLVQGKAAEVVDPAGKFRLKNGDVACDVSVASDGTFAATIGESTAQNHGTPLKYQQLRLTRTAPAWRVATAFDAWNHGSLAVTLKPLSGGAYAVQVKGNGVDDAWTWSPVAKGDATTRLAAQRGGKPLFELKPN
jgi:hypothetical protein